MMSFSDTSIGALQYEINVGLRLDQQHPNPQLGLPLCLFIATIGRNQQWKLFMAQRLACALSLPKQRWCYS